MRVDPGDRITRDGRFAEPLISSSEKEKGIMVIAGPKVITCKCGTLILWSVTVAGKWMPLEYDSRHSTYAPGDWTVDDEGRSSPGMPMFDTVFVTPHWANCEHADEYRQHYE